MRVRPFVSASFVAEAEPVVVAPPSVLAQAVDKAVVYNAPTMVNGRPVDLVATAVSKPAPRDRIVVDGVDITYFRGKRTPTPPYRLTEPFAYGSATLVVPQISAVFESQALGAGELSWARKGAVVRIQRVDPADSSKVTDYWGRIMGRRISGATWTFEVGGILVGPAEARNKQVPVYRRVKDLGRWMFDAIENAGNFPGVHFTPRLGPTTGIELADTGGMTHLGWLQHLCAMAQRRNGDQFTVMPTVAGGKTFELRLKDRTTIDCTIYLDDARAVPELYDDAMEQWNTGFGTCVTPDGMYVDGTVLPGVDQAAPPPFPGTLSVGDSGDDVIVLQWKLIRARLLDREDADGTFDADTADAVRDLQDMANLPQTGVVNSATWDALFDDDVTGFSLNGARIMPMVQRSKVRPWNYTADGSLAGRNPGYDPDALRVDRNIDFGSGITEKAMRDYLRGHMARLTDDSFAGTITLNGVGVIAGEHNPGDPAPTSDRVLAGRDVQPGWNAWLPNFNGGTLVHIAENDVQPGSEYDTCTLTVDTDARDALELAEIIDRNRESRRSPRREWVKEQRGSEKIPDAITPFNKKAGIITREWDLPADEWTLVPIFVGEAGTVSKVLWRLTNPCEFAFSLWAKNPAGGTDLVAGAKVLNRRVGNPFPVNADDESVWTNSALDDFFDARLMVLAAGDEKQPCGYGRKLKFKADGTASSAPLIGTYEDAAGFGYYTFDWPVLWAGFYPKQATKLKRGRALWAQLEAGS